MSGGHSEIDKLINHFENGGTRDSFKRGGKVLSEDLSLSHKEAGHTPNNPPKGMVYDPITKKFVNKVKSKGESVISPKKKKGIPLSEQETKMTILGPLPTGKSKIYKKGGKIKEEDFAAHVEEASSMDKEYSEYDRPKTSYEKTPMEKGVEKFTKRQEERRKKRRRKSMESLMRDMGRTGGIRSGLKGRAAKKK